MTEPSRPAGPSPTDGSTGPKRLLVLTVVGLAIAGLAVVAFFLLPEDQPDEVNLDAAGDQVSAADDGAVNDQAVDDLVTASSVDNGGSAGIEGSWSVDTSVGEFAFEDSTGSFVGFRVDEELSSVGAITAVGRTPEVAGTMVIADNTVTETAIEADMTALVTDDSRRDSKARSALGTAEFPTATFRLTEPISLPDDASVADFSVDAVGELTIKGVTNPATVPLEARLVDDTIVVVGSTAVVFADYGVEAPSAPIVLSVDDEGVIEFQLFFART